MIETSLLKTCPTFFMPQPGSPSECNHCWTPILEDKFL